MTSINHLFGLESNDTCLKYCFTISGAPIHSVADIKPDTKVLIVSPLNEFKGLKGLTKLKGMHCPQDLQSSPTNSKEIKNILSDLCKNWVDKNNLH